MLPLRGRALARDHRLLLADALAAALPWLADDALAAVHAVRLVPGGGESALLSARARLVLRVARERAADLQALAGRTLRVGADDLALGTPQVRELLPHTTLYAHFVDAGGADEAAFLAQIGADLERMDVACHRVCGRAQRVRGAAGMLNGFSLMLHGLRAAASLRVLERGLGAHRLMGCGVFVPHKSAAAVGD
ncbi:MAG: type I-MYXAN CRISPR-associated protein Cas6/Cmx6 [Piscinibacter sp.]|nr:type I-MYXAN CRISPR-associated protein Cas6/Cmx6 [Piscinibacter sp.]